ncbi:MAG: GntR family transcriptional regulator [Anaerolineales bacterium]|nr:MAG: GntR family transcriptional regulator [Anaerolineales bacterium]
MVKTETFLYQEIAESLRRRIASGDLQPGDKLPPVRETARQWDCTPGTVGRAYAQLAQEGLVAGHRGGGTRVTPNALQPEHPTWHWASLINQAEQFLLAAIRGGHTPAQAEAALSAAISRWLDLGREGTPPPPASIQVVERLRFVGSHDLTIELISRMLSEEASQAQLCIEYVGSLGGLIALARNEAEVAGTHLWDETTDTYNLPFVQRLLPGRQVVLVTLAHRSLGLITPSGNPQQLRNLWDLGHPDVRLINRQSGSGTRVWLDAQFKALDISPESVPGYDQEESTHLAVARAVDQGQATVGLGIHAAASAYELDFIPLTQERYDLVFPEPVWSTPVAQALVTVIRSPRFKQAVAALGGYDTSETGLETWIP